MCASGMLAYASGGYLLAQMVDVRLRERRMSAGAGAGMLAYADAGAPIVNRRNEWVQREIVVL